MNHEELLVKIFAMLIRGTTDRKSPLHTPTVATIGADGSPNARVVVFRKFLQDERILIFHTDLRSPKIEEIRNEARISWLLYHPNENLQLRISGKAVIHSEANDALKLQQWQATWNFGRRCYMGAAPSRISETPTSGLPDAIAESEPTKEESEVGFPNFAVISTKISSIDCLELHIKGHRRSLFNWKENGDLNVNWLTP